MYFAPCLQLCPSPLLFPFLPLSPFLPSLSGPLRDDDLQVLLSERAAHQIWQKWVDTLEVGTCIPYYILCMCAMYVCFNVSYLLFRLRKLKFNYTKTL